MPNEKQPIQRFWQRRYASRKPVSLKLQAWVDGEERVLAVRDLSHTGFLAEATPPLQVDQTIELELPDEGRKQATVVWAGEALAGCTFAGSISRASYSAALLKSQFLELPPGEAATPSPEAAPPIADDIEWEADKLPPRERMAIMIAGGALAWAPVLLIAYLLFA